MISGVHESGDNDGAKEVEIVPFKELREELARLRENDRERQDTINQLVKDNEKMGDQLRVLERLLTDNHDSAASPKSSKSGNVEKESDRAKMLLNDQELTKTLIKLTCKCIVINKKFKYLRRLMKMNHRKLNDIEKVTKSGMENQRKTVEDKICQVTINKDLQKNSVSVGTTTSEDRLDAAALDSDMLLSDVFYLPTRPDLPDLRLFDLL